jgi:uncharacterized membrane protein YgdD (TMEM256/DUF423 family)
MTVMPARTISIGSCYALLAVLLGAFGAHGLKGRVAAAQLEVFHTAVQYHFYHALGLILIGVLGYHIQGSAWLKWSARTMQAGIILFSGSLYLLALTGARWLGMITPIGGVAFIVAWLFLAMAAFNRGQTTVS